MNLLAAIEPTLPGESGSGRALTFDNAWLWPVLLIAGLFIGYLCLDAWIIYRRNKRMNQWRRRAKQTEVPDPIRR